ncbi:hypothetical protein BD626DRAFT_573180 [Schizophyllum amplum]|uniref:Uncharacterized protein n=1 Tax=Schizophyllum amplum TaxID=97359 RepID=A0A550C2B1_9AGAR|nr:hypothetical protein BD626DRAFT_573180 [Auriculariopsis ampla]
MSAEDALTKLCREPDTLEAAHALLRRAKARTAPGSGFDLGASINALPAICAYKASQSLNNNDVSRSAAQANSCIAPKAFDEALHKVEAALCDTRRSITQLSYSDIVRKHAGSIYASTALLSVLGKIDEALEAARENKYRSHDKMPGVLFWVCMQKTGEDMFDRAKFCRTHTLRPATLDKLLDDLDKHASALKIQALNAFSQPAASRPSSPTKSPAKRDLPHGGSPPKKKAPPVRELPHGGSPHKNTVRELPHGGSPHKTQQRKPVTAGSPTKPKPLPSPRKGAPPLPMLFPNAPQQSEGNSESDDEADLLAAPRKRRKVETAAEPPTATDDASTSNGVVIHTTRTRASPAKTKASIAKPAPAVDESDVSASPRRSTRVKDAGEVHIQASPRKATKSKIDEVVMPVESDASDDEEPPPPRLRRRFRPVFLDTVQWNARDPLAVKLELSRKHRIAGTAA